MNIEQIRVVFEFKLNNDILLEKGLQLKKMEQELHGRIRILSMPINANGNTPVAFFELPNIIVSIGTKQYEYIVNIPLQFRINFLEATEYVKKELEPIINYLVIEKNDYQFCGIIAPINYPVNSDELKNINQTIFRKLVNIKTHGEDLTSFRLQFSTQINNFFKNVSISGYKKANIQTQIQLGIEVKSKVDILETGIQVIIDVNNKAKLQNDNQIHDMIEIFNQIKAVYEKVPELIGDLS